MSAAFNVTPGASEPDAALARGASEAQHDAQVASRTRGKRSQVVRACGWCRKHRVKCDNHYPCSNCANRGGECSNETMKAFSLPWAYREIDRLRLKVKELERELQEERARESPIHHYPNQYPLASNTLPPQNFVTRPNMETHSHQRLLPRQRLRVRRLR